MLLFLAAVTVQPSNSAACTRMAVHIMPSVALFKGFFETHLTRGCSDMTVINGAM